MRINGVLSILSMAFLISCGESNEKTGPRVSIRLEAPSLEAFSLPLVDTAQPAPFSPLNVRNFTCYFVNVMGPGIGNWTSLQGALTNNRGAADFSLYSPTISQDGGSAQFAVPAGSARIFQAIGVTSTQSCPSSLSSDDIFNGDVYKGIFEVGRLTTDIKANADVTIVSNFNPFTVRDARILQKPSIATLDSQVPSTGTGIIRANGTGGSIQLAWPAASDNGTPSNYLLYQVISSTTSTSAINSIKNALTAGTIIVNWTLNLTTTTVASLDTFIAYTVLVMDAAGNISQYPPIAVPRVPQLSYAGVDGSATLGVPVTIKPSLLSANGAAITSCAVKSGSAVNMPSWASINQSTCVISGTPDALLNPTTVTIVAHNAVGDSLDAPITMSVHN